MSDGITREEFNAHMGVVQQGLAETSTEIRELAKSVNSFVQASTRTEERTNHLAHEVDEVKDNLKDVTHDVTILKTRSSNNMLRWAFLVSVVTVIIGLSTWAYSTFRQPQADVKAAIIEQTKVEQAILEYLRGGE